MSRKMGDETFSLDFSVPELRKKVLLEDCKQVFLSLSGHNRWKLSIDKSKTAITIVRWLLEKLNHSRKVSKILENKVKTLLEQNKLLEEKLVNSGETNNEKNRHSGSEK